MERIAMSQAERDKLEWLKRASDKVVSQRETAEKIGVSERWVRKLLQQMREQGDSVVVHGLRGRHDFGPTFASQQLAKRHGIEVSDETVRRWMIESGLWKPGARRIEDAHFWRPRRSGFGELTLDHWQGSMVYLVLDKVVRAAAPVANTSEHDWLEGRGPVRYLVRMIDDATSWSWGRFVERDATPFNMAVLWEYVEKNGRMVDVYTHRDSMFTVPLRPGERKDQQRETDRLTQLGRALRELGIGSILAYSPQAKGRIERSFLTAQDRLVKDLRLAGISTMQAANEFLEKEYWPEWNTRFARPVQEFPNHHRPLTEHLELAAILCHVEQRVIGNDYTFSFASRRYQIARGQAQAGMRHQQLRLELRLDGELKARYQGRYLHIAECGARVVPEPVVRKTVRKDYNAGGKSTWMQGFFDRPSPPLWKSLGDGR